MSTRAIFLDEAREKNRRGWIFVGMLVLMVFVFSLFSIAGGWYLAMGHRDRMDAIKADQPKPAPFNCKQALRQCAAQGWKP